MSELIQKHDNRATIRWKLLTGVSALALTAYVSSSSMARAEDAGQPQLWIELGGQLSRLDDGHEIFAPDLMSARPSIFAPSQKFEHAPLNAIDEYGKLSFQPDGSDWDFSASIRYGRSVSRRNVHQQTTPNPVFLYFTSTYLPSYRIGVYPQAAKFANTNARDSEHYLIVDFQAGKDVGLGMFGGKGSSVLGFGVRFAQFNSKSNITLNSDPDWQFYYHHGALLPRGSSYHSNVATMQAARSFRGVGPSISWSASAPIAGNPENSELTLDWGLNAALLFGKQRARTHHQTTGQYHSHVYFGVARHVTYQNTPPTSIRSRSVTVPNVGGFAGLSFRYADAKISFGYRGDFFLNAIDGGIDTVKKENRGFYGPYASISIGLGD